MASSSQTVNVHQRVNVGSPIAGRFFHGKYPQKHGVNPPCSDTKTSYQLAYASDTPTIPLLDTHYTRLYPTIIPIKLLVFCVLYVFYTMFIPLLLGLTQGSSALTSCLSHQSRHRDNPGCRSSGEADLSTPDAGPGSCFGDICYIQLYLLYMYSTYTTKLYQTIHY